MASETAAKWIAILVIYFFVMSFVVGLITQISPVTVTTAEGSGTYTGCGHPRTIYEQFSPDPIDIEGSNPMREEYYYGQIKCGHSAGVLDSSVCGNLTGCTWDDPASWWQTLWGAGGVDTCTGELDYPTVTNDTTTYLFDTVINNYEGGGFSGIGDVCYHPNVLENESLCAVFSCTWAEWGTGIDEIDNIDLDIKPSLLGNMWRTIKDMFLFRFEYGFTNASGNAILNFLIFYLPLLAIILAIIVMVRG